MKEIRFQMLIDWDNKVLPDIHTALVKPGQSFEVSNKVELRRCKSMIIPFGDTLLQPRRIEKRRDGSYVMAYGWPRGKSWSQGSMFADIKVIEII